MRQKYILIGFLVFLLSGCATSPKYAKHIVGAGYPDEYYEGFAAGCDSGEERASFGLSVFRKDNNAYASNRFYKSGWNDGLIRCYNDAIELDKKWRERRMEQAIDKYLYEQNK